MTKGECFIFFGSIPDRESYLEELSFMPLVVDLYPAILTAAVDMAGYLEDARTPDDLMAGLNHYSSCYGAGIFTCETLRTRAEEVFLEVMAEYAKECLHEMGALDG